MSSSSDTSGEDQYVDPDPQSGRSLATVAKRGVLALSLSVLAVSAARAVQGAIITIPPEFGPLNWWLVLGGTVVAAVLATGFYALVSHVTERPERDFVVAAALITFSMIIPVVTYGTLLPGATDVLLAAFSLLEIVVAATITIVMVGGLGVPT
jgi:hypothetical protein